MLCYPGLAGIDSLAMPVRSGTIRVVSEWELLSNDDENAVSLNLAG